MFFAIAEVTVLELGKSLSHVHADADVRLVLLKVVQPANKVKLRALLLQLVPTLSSVVLHLSSARMMIRQAIFRRFYS